MSQPLNKNLQTFTRMTHPDPKINQIVQDLYDKLAQAQAQIAKLQPTNPSP